MGFYRSVPGSYTPFNPNELAGSSRWFGGNGNGGGPLTLGCLGMCGGRWSDIRLKVRTMTNFKPYMPGDIRQSIEAAAEAVPEPVEQPHRRCIHVGEPTSDLVGCLTCQGARLKTRQCTLHNVPCVTSIRRPDSGVRWCRACDDHTAD